MKRISPYLLISFLTLFCLWIHFSHDTNSMLNDFNQVVSNEYLSSTVDYHQSHPAFQRRPITTFLIKKTALYANTSIGTAFVTVNFLFLFISGILLYRLSLLFENSTPKALGNVIIYFTSFTILFAFFVPIYSYDEPIQFTFLFLSLISLRKEKWSAYIIFFSLSVVARESSLILLPGILLLSIRKQSNQRFFSFYSKENLLKIGFILSPLFVYLIFLMFFFHQGGHLEETQTVFMDRFSLLRKNMQDQRHALETIFSIFLVIGLPLYLLFQGVGIQSEDKSKYSRCLRAFVITVILNSMVVLITTQAREARLLVLPLFFIWPIFTKLFHEDIKLMLSFKNYRTSFNNIYYLSFFIFLNVLNGIISFKIYETTIGHPIENYFNEYLFLLIFLMLTHATLKHRLKNSENKS